MPGISRRQMVGGLLSWQLVARPRPAAADQARFRLLEKALWVWKDRISAPDDLEAFARANGIRTLFPCLSGCYPHPQHVGCCQAPE